MQSNPLDRNADPKATDLAAMHEKLLRENDRLRGDLLTIARRFSHDLRTPLGGIISADEAIIDLLAETDPATVPLALSSLNCAEEISQLIKRVSLVVKATAQPVVPQLLGMGSPLSTALQRLESRILKTGAAITKPVSWPNIHGVEAWLEVVWWNLLSNSLLHAGHSPRIELGWRQENKKIQFWISDNGPGIPAAQRSKLFQPFHTLHELESTRGLGLSIVQRLVELQGGDCGHESPPGGGTRFFFALP